MDEKLLMLFSSNLRDLLSECNKSQADMCKYMKISSATASDWCNGKKMPRADKLQSLCSWLGCNLDELIGNARAKSPAAVSQDPNEERLVSAYRSFNALGRERLMDYVGYLESKPENLSPELFPSTKEEGDGLSSGGIA